MRRVLLAGLAVGICAVFGVAGPAAALELSTTIDLDYSYTQDNAGGDVNAATMFNQKYEIKYGTTLTTSYDFIGAVRLDLQDAWYTDQAATSRVVPTLELSTKGSLLAARVAYEALINSTDTYNETGDVTEYSTNLSFDLEMTPQLWPEVRLRYQRRFDYQAYSKEITVNSLELAARKDIYGLRLEFNLKREESGEVLPAARDSTDTAWSAKATYKEVFWGGTEFELAYEINESYQDEQTRGVFVAETANYHQTLKTRFKNSLVIAPRLTLNLVWEYQFEQDLLALEFDYNLKNKYAIELRWDAYDWLKITSEARRETELEAAVVGIEDEESVTDSIKTTFELTTIPWLDVSGRAEFKRDEKIDVETGGSVDKVNEEKYELIAKNRLGEFWDFTWAASSSITHTDGFRTADETRVKGDLKFKLFGLDVVPGYEVSRSNEGRAGVDYLVNQQRVRDATIKFEYEMQLSDMFKATFSHEYGVKVEDTLDEVLNFDRIVQFNEGTRLTILVAEFFRDMSVEAEIDRKASDTEGDTDPQLVELAYALKLDWKFEHLSLLSSLKYNDKGDAFDDVSFNAKATWKGERLEVTGEYQIDKIIKDATEPKDEKRKLNLRLNYKF